MSSGTVTEPAAPAESPRLAPALVALMAWPVLGPMPTPTETLGLIAVMGGVALAVTTASRH